MYRFKVVMQVINIGGNRKCFGCVEEGNEERLIVCFSWYNPRTAMDYATLGALMMLVFLSMLFFSGLFPSVLISRLPPRFLLFSASAP
eukprot:1295160-Rhodomonas_salina.2